MPASARAGASALACCCLLLSACGGSGSGSAATAPGMGGGSAASDTTDVLTYHYDNQRTGQNLAESVLTPANVSASTFGLLRTLPTDDVVDATPLIATGVPVNGANHTVLYAGTEKASIYAYDADTGMLLRQASLLAPGESPSDTRGCDQVQPEIGITATPVIDRSQGPNGTLYVVAMSKDAAGAYHQRLHALDLSTLAERVPPVEIDATASGSGSSSQNGMLTFDPGQYKERGALLAANGQIYTVWASHCDDEFYNGWIIAYDEGTLARTAVLNYTPNGTMGAIWNVGGLAADSTGTLYAMAGNGTFDTTLSSTGFPVGGDYGNTVFRLAASASGLTVVDYYTPINTVDESNQDEDLGSGSPLLLPDQADATGSVRHLFVGAGKDGNLLLLDRDNLGKFNGSTDTAYQRLSSSLQSVFSAFAYFNGSIYIADIGGSLKAFSLTQARLSASPTSQSAATFPYPGTSPSISASGTSHAILWAVNSATNQPAILHAYNPANLAQEYYNSATAAGNRDSFGAGNKFVTPVVANGRVFVATPSGVAVFGLLQ